MGPDASIVGQRVDYTQKKMGNNEAQEGHAMAFQNIHCLSTKRRWRRWRGKESTSLSTVGRLPPWSRKKRR